MFLNEKYSGSVMDTSSATESLNPLLTRKTRA
jgi:hypothetical protein